MTPFFYSQFSKNISKKLCKKIAAVAIKIVFVPITPTNCEKIISILFWLLFEAYPNIIIAPYTLMEYTQKPAYYYIHKIATCP
jgi:hypothetical protein